jgi:hypothetical protein
VNEKRSFFARLERLWTRWQVPRTFVWQSLLRVPWLCFYNVVGALLLVYLFAFNEQGLDLLRISAERGFWSAGILWNLLFLLGTIVLSISFWYTSRLLLGRDFQTYPLHPLHAEFGRRWLPRLLVALVPIAIGLSFFRLESAAYGARTLLGVLYLLIGAALFVFYVLRRRLPRADRGWMLATREARLPDRDERLVKWAIGLSFVLLAAFMLLPVRLPQLIGAPAIIVFGFTGITLVGSMLLTYWFLTQGRPGGTTLVLLIALLAGLVNDNHEVRRAQPGEPLARLPPAEHYAEWRRHHPPPAAGDGEPVILVTASGGGIRAAYWTAAALARMQRIAGFEDNLFAISGVSGGSLGASVYVTLKRHQLDHGVPQDIGAAVREVLAQDFLSPVVAGMLFPDLAQRFIPLPLPWADRQRFLELSWEAALGEAGGLFGAAFSGLYSGDARFRLPSLLLNATLVDSGQRAVVSNLRLDEFSDTVDLLADGLATRLAPVSAAAGMSARFTYVSPAGTVERAQGEPLRVVDGGYFENSGAASVLDLLNQIRKAQRRYRPILILIRNDPQAPDVCRRGDGDGEPPPGGTFNAALSELAAPFQALLNTRQARGRLAEVEAARQVEALGGVVVEIPLAAVVRTRLTGVPGEADRQRLKRRMIEPPLGWSLSDEVRHDMDRVLDELSGGLQRELERLEAALAGEFRVDCEAR